MEYTTKRRIEAAIKGWRKRRRNNLERQLFDCVCAPNLTVQKALKAAEAKRDITHTVSEQDDVG